MTEAKKKKAIDYFLGVCRQIDTLVKLADGNEKYWKNIFDKMDLETFQSFIKDLKEQKTALYVYVPISYTAPQAKVYALCHEHDVEIEQHVVMRDDVTGVKFVTPEKYPVIRTVCRRLEQYYEKKVSLPSGDTHTDTLTGQVIHDDRAAGISHPELTAILFKDVPEFIDEIMIRGGNVASYQSDMKASLEATGSFSTKDKSKDNISRTLITTDTFLSSMGFESSLMERGD
jgi:hypothetical protein